MKVITVKDLAACVVQARKKRGWTQAQLAVNSGVSRAWIIGLEKAKPTLEISLVLRTMKTLNLPLLVGERPQMGSSNDEIILDDVLNNQRNVPGP